MNIFGLAGDVKDWSDRNNAFQLDQSKAPLATDPNNVPGYTPFDYSGMKKAMAGNLSLQRARRDQGIIGQNVGANPYGGSSQLGRGLGRSASDTTSSINDVNAGLDRQSYGEKVQAMNDYNLRKQLEYNAALQKQQGEAASNSWHLF